ncbi:MAG: C39 family peptidase [Anaerolineaceae bacterium]|nr:C39 family peptidase [Anaerolineaceae bacterium]
MPKFLKFVFSALLISVVGFIITSQSLLLFNLIKPISVLLQPAPESTQTPEIIYVTTTYTPFQPVTNTATYTNTPTPTNTWTPTATSTFTATFPPTNTPIPYIPPTTDPETDNDSGGDSYRIWNISGHHQYMPLSCEASAAVDWANYFGVSIDEYDFQAAYPITDNPDTGFVGDVYGEWGQIPPNSYGVHSEPVATVLRSYGLSAHGHRWMTLDDLKNEIRNGDPVIVWVTGNVWTGYPISYTDSSGITTTVAKYEHVVLAIGYTESTIVIQNGAGVYEYTYEKFLSAWNPLENQGITN